MRAMRISGTERKGVVETRYTYIDILVWNLDVACFAMDATTVVASACD